MAENKGYPQIPGRVWWGVRDMINKSPNMKFDENNLAVTLNVQPVAARQYLKELERIGILDEDGSPSDLGKKWRLDDQYEEAVERILDEAYPSGLTSIAPLGGADRSIVERWFQNDGLGSGTAKNKAGTYIMIANDRPGEVKVRSAPKAKDAADGKPAAKSPPRESKKDAQKRSTPQHSSKMPDLNVNVQIHISADASSEQIEMIFSSMRKYLGNEAS
ncbi:hypothetical protein [Qipengyuania sp. MTN3-11]|uniref:hypothetical protein n=1 Tax=Qipengyuania sp. MTN3-11 TaxID=3056557 RepID=UPI0036F33A13